MMLANLPAHPRFIKQSNITRIRTKIAASRDTGRALKSNRNDVLFDELKPYCMRFNLSDQVVLKKRYLLVDVLGCGGMSEVYKARDLRKEKYTAQQPCFVALKVHSQEYRTHPQAIQNLTAEAELLKRISHPNVVRALSAECYQGIPFMTMEYIKGATLEELVQQYSSCRMCVDDALNLIKKIASALSYLHAHRIVHADLKPGNVLVANGEAKLFDFGNSRWPQKLKSNRSSVEQVGQINQVGQVNNEQSMTYTPAYASVEMIAGEAPDFSDDIYALGCIAYELFTGEHPYQKKPADKVAQSGQQANPITHIKPLQWSAIEKTIALNKQDRTATVNDFYREFCAH